MIPIKDRNPTELFPLVTIALILTNAALFIYQLSQGFSRFEHFTMSFAVVPSAFTSAPFSPAQHSLVFTSMFLHGGFLHITGNMLFLWIFGNNIEDYFGHFKFAVFYLACGVAGTMAHIFTHASSPVPVIGASGAISGVLGAYFLLFPRARVLTLVPIFFFLYFIEVPAFIFLGVYIVLQPRGRTGGAGRGMAGAHRRFFRGRCAAFLPRQATRFSQPGPALMNSH